ncbi:ribonuclease H-like domain-containing protein [Mycena sanguinolenta]|nr:ribonuclease H-like domain-containing protein [Mycena sanguinolenta]
MPLRGSQRNTDQEAAPSSEAAGGHVTRRSANQPQAATPSNPRPTPAQAASTGGQAHNFAPLACQLLNQNLAPIQEISTPPAGSRLQFTPSTPVTALPSRVQTLPQTPARIVASQLVEQLGSQSAMVSPGPRLRDPGNDDSESKSAEEFDLGSDSEAPPRNHPLLTSHTATEPPAFISLNSENEGSPPPIRTGSHRTAGRGRRGGRSACQDPRPSDTDIPSVPPAPSQPRPRQPQARTGVENHTVDDQNFAWAEESILQNASTPEMKYFFGRHTQSGTWKCCMCSCVYAAGTSISSRRKHLEGQHVDEYLDAIHQHTWAHKPSADHAQQLEGQRTNHQRVPFSTASLANQLVRVIVSNDLLWSLIIDAWLDYLEELKVELQIGHFTLDNASNNMSFMTQFAILLRSHDISGFNAKKNYIRCFAHIINLCSQAVIRAMERDKKDVDYPDTDTEPGTDSNISDDDGGITIRPIRQRLDQFLEIIQQGNDDKTWNQVVIVDGQAEKVAVNLSLVTLFPDVKTRWDSVFFMLWRLQYLQQPVTQFFVTNRDALLRFNHPLESTHRNRLEVLELILQQPHTVQTIMSSENTPILAAAIPAFELFMKSWNSMLTDPLLANKNIQQLIAPGLAVTNKYYSSKEIYSPIHFNQLSILQFVLGGLLRIGPSWTERRQGQLFSNGMRGPSAGAIALALATEQYRNAQQSLNFSNEMGSPRSAAWSEAEELDNYICSPIPPRASTDMIGYWTNHGHTLWPTIYHLFLDFGPIQATSVLSEQVFLSSAETDTKRRNCINPMLMEALQMLKFTYKKSRLNFMVDWQSAPIAAEEEDWLRNLASKSGGEEEEAIRKEVLYSFDFADTAFPEMPEEM